MKIANWLQLNIQLLTEHNITSPRLDCLLLLEDLLQKNRASILAHLDDELNTQQLQLLSRSIARRKKHVPISYIRGRSEFYKREFIVTENVLQPRPESEHIIDLFKIIPDRQQTVIDLGTGSGALIITIAHEASARNLIAVDIDPSCIEVAKKNATVHNANINFINSNLLQNVDQKLLENSIIIANLPYVPNEYRLNKAAYHEPSLAIFGGKDGLDIYRKLFEQINSMRQADYIITECLKFQHNSLRKLAEANDYIEIARKNLIQLFTVRGRPQE